MVTVLPVPVPAGVKEVITGGPANTNPVSSPVPYWLVTVMLPDAPLPTTAEMVEASTTEKEVTGTPPKSTALVPVKFPPVIETVTPAAAGLG